MKLDEPRVSSYGIEVPDAGLAVSHFNEVLSNELKIGQRIVPVPKKVTWVVSQGESESTIGFRWDMLGVSFGDTVTVIAASDKSIFVTESHGWRIETVKLHIGFALAGLCLGASIGLSMPAPEAQAHAPLAPYMFVHLGGGFGAFLGLCAPYFVYFPYVKWAYERDKRVLHQLDALLAGAKRKWMSILEGANEA